MATIIGKFFQDHNLRPFEWYRWSVAFIVFFVGGFVLATDHDSKATLALLPTALVAVAIATVDLGEKPRSKLACKLGGIFLATIPACYALSTVVAKGQTDLIMVVANLISISGMIFGIYVMLATSWPLVKSRMDKH